MKLMMSVRTHSIIAGLALAAAALFIPRAVAAQIGASYQAIVGKSDAIFLFPADDTATLAWFQPGTKVGTLEYAWKVQVPATVYRLGVSLYTPPASAAVPDSGPLADLLRLAQRTLWARQSDKTSVAVRGVQLEVTLLPGQLVLHLDDSAAVAMLFAHRPDAVVMARRIASVPADSIAVPVRYTDQTSKLWVAPRTAENPIRIGDTAPDFDLPALDDGGAARIRRGSLVGQPHLLYFWSAACPVSRQELAALAAAAAEWKQGVKVIGIALGDREANRLAAGEVPRSTIVHAAGDDSVAAAYGLRGTPLYVLVDGTGVIVHIVTGAGQTTSTSTLRHKIEDQISR